MRVAQPSKQQREGGEPQIGLRFTAARGEVNEVDVFAVGVMRTRDSVEIEKQEGELEGGDAVSSKPGPWPCL